jgi:hypothetical protein
MSVGKKLNKKELLSSNLATKKGYCTQRMVVCVRFCHSHTPIQSDTANWQTDIYNVLPTGGYHEPRLNEQK